MHDRSVPPSTTRAGSARLTEREPDGGAMADRRSDLQSCRRCGRTQCTSGSRVECIGSWRRALLLRTPRFRITAGTSPPQRIRPSSSQRVRLPSRSRSRGQRGSCCWVDGAGHRSMPTPQADRAAGGQSTVPSSMRAKSSDAKDESTPSVRRLSRRPLPPRARQPQAVHSAVSQTRRRLPDRRPAAAAAAPACVRRRCSPSGILPCCRSRSGCR